MSSRKTAVADHGSQIPIGGGDNAHVDRNFIGAAHAAHPPFLQSTQEFCLHADVKFGNLVEKERAAISDFEQAFLVHVGAGERTLLVAEQFRLEQILVDRGAVDGLKHF